MCSSIWNAWGCAWELAEWPDRVVPGVRGVGVGEVGGEVVLCCLLTNSQAQYRSANSEASPVHFLSLLE